MRSTKLVKWWLTTCAFITAGAVLQYLEIWQLLWDTDSTGLSAIILVLFTFVTTYLGIKTYQHSRGQSVRLSNMPWFLAGAMTKLGLIGTVIGFMYMLIGPFGSIDVTDVNQAKVAIAAIASGMGIALTTTLVGLLCQLLTEFQLIWLVDEQHDDDAGS